ncbi:hypothetical protein Nmel_017370 [Mimus melanotis]
MSVKAISGLSVSSCVHVNEMSCTPMSPRVCAWVKQYILDVQTKQIQPVQALLAELSSLDSPVKWVDPARQGWDVTFSPLRQVCTSGIIVQQHPDSVSMVMLSRKDVLPHSQCW